MRRHPRARARSKCLGDQRPAEARAARLVGHVDVLQPAVVGGRPDRQPVAQLADACGGVAPVGRGQQELGVRLAQQRVDRRANLVVAWAGRARCGRERRPSACSPVRRPAPRRPRPASQPLTACRSQVSGTPFSSWTPRSANSIPDPATRSFTVLRHEHLARLGERAHPRGDVNGDAAEVVPHHLALAGVQAGPHLDPQLARGVDDRPRAADAARRPVEAHAGTRPRVDLTSRPPKRSSASRTPRRWPSSTSRQR